MAVIRPDGEGRERRDTRRMSPHTPDTRPRIVVAGGGVGGLEAVLALREMLGDLASIELVSPERDFLYRAMSVAEPFGRSEPLRIRYRPLAEAHLIHHRRDAVLRVDTAASTVELGDGERLRYDALVVATGARPEAWLANALTYTGPPALGEMRALLARIAAREVRDVVFTLPPEGAWALPAYELAFLTATWCAERAVATPALHVASPEAAPLDVFGRGATTVVRDLLADRGVAFHAQSPVSAFDGARARLADGTLLDADAVVALPRLVGNALAGLPTGERGFVPVADDGLVAGTADVYAIGDAADHPIKQGGLAAQQADAAAAAIARGLGVAVEPPVHRPVMRGVLLTGMSPAFLRSGPDGGAGFNAMWWPPAKVAGRHLAAYLSGMPRPEPLTDRPAAIDLEGAARDREEVRAMALSMASADAQWGEWDSAARWLQTVEWIDGVLPAELAARRDRYLRRAQA